LPATARKVGVFVDAGESDIRRLAGTAGLSVIQLHGDESPACCRAIRQAGLEVWKVFPVGGELDMGRLASYADSCDRFLFDTAGRRRGGNGTAFDWNLLLRYAIGTPFLLSGGIGPADAPAIRNFLRQAPEPLRQACVGVDINSRFETKPGTKQILSIKHFQHELNRT
jgi:phosphoribosylanthranilate isomerase